MEGLDIICTEYLCSNLQMTCKRPQCYCWRRDSGLGLFGSRPAFSYQLTCFPPKQVTPHPLESVFMLFIAQDPFWDATGLPTQTWRILTGSYFKVRPKAAMLLSVGDLSQNHQGWERTVWGKQRLSPTWGGMCCLSFTRRGRRLQSTHREAFLWSIQS